MDVTPRPLTAGEAAVLDRLLGVAVPGAQALRVQAAQARVVGGCDCGCPTIYLTVPDAPVSTVAVRSGLFPVEAHVIPVAGEATAQVLLFITDERLDSLEYAGLQDGPVDWPAPDRIRVFPTPR